MLTKYMQVYIPHSSDKTKRYHDVTKSEDIVYIPHSSDKTIS